MATSKIFWPKINIFFSNLWTIIFSILAYQRSSGVKLSLNRAVWSKYTKYTYVSTQNFVSDRNSKLIEVKSGHKKHQRSILGQTCQIGLCGPIENIILMSS